VLVVGSAQSGCQIVEDLHLGGRKVYLVTSGAGRAPRRYRGRDCYEWLVLAGFVDRTPDKLPSPKAKFGPNPHVSGARGGRSLNLHQFARDGVTLLGHLRGANERKLAFAPDLADNLARADKFEADLVKLVDGYIEKAGVTAPKEQLPELRDGYAAKETLELDLAQAGIRTIIWAMGYSFNFNLVKAPVFDEDGYPVQTRGATSYRGLCFVGLPWLYKQKSGLLLGVGDDAAHIADAIVSEWRNKT
jgi:putative flavoprotein involved in K+ transport